MENFYAANNNYRSNWLQLLTRAWPAPDLNVVQISGRYSWINKLLR
jgi:hypothetical protein